MIYNESIIHISFQPGYLIWATEQVRSLVLAITKVGNKSELISNLKQLIGGKADVVLTFNYGVRFRVRDFYDILAVYEMWENQPYRQLFEDLNEQVTFIDIGGYNGDSSVYAGRVSGVKKIIAVEPLPDNFGLLKENLSLNGIKGTKAIRAVVSGTTGKRKIYLYPNKRQVGQANLDYNIGSTEVGSVTLSNLVKGIHGPIVLKCDAEGAEYEIFMNTPEKVLTRINKILFEYHFGYFMDQKKLDLLVNRLTKAGFTCSIHKNKWLDGLGYVFAR